MKKEAQIRRSKGITLIALVITIVILIILSTTVINMTFGDDGLIGQAEYARDLTANSTYAEAEQMNALLAEYADIVTPPEPSVPTRVSDLIGGEILPDTTTVEDGIGNEVVIPGGFKIALDSGTNVEDGIVIEDSEGNQFVWIPTGTYQTTSGEKTNELTRRTFTSAGATPVSGDSEIEAYYYGEGDSRSVAHDSINNFLNSAKPVSEGGNGGFYIGRYEQGTGNVCKAGVDAYVSRYKRPSKSTGRGYV